MNRLVSNKPLSVWRFLIVAATIFTLAPIITLLTLFLETSVPLAEIVFSTYEEQVLNNARYLIPILGLLFVYGQWHKQASADDSTNMTPIVLPFSISLSIGLFNKALLIATIIGAFVVALDSSIFAGITLFIATIIATGTGAVIKYALIDAGHPSQPLLMVGAIAISLLASWLASSSSVTYNDIILLGGYWAPAVGCLIGLTALNKSPDTVELNE